MAEPGRAPGRGEIQQPPAVLADQIRAVAAHHRLREEPQMGHAGQGFSVAFVEAGHAKSFQAKNSRTRSEEHSSELQSLMRNSYAVFCLIKKNKYQTQHITHEQ